jgi:hypothetical protein
MTMQRRVFIQLSAYTAAILALPFANGCATTPTDAKAQPLFFSHLVDAKTIVETGRAYRKANQKEDDENKLKALLSAASGLSASNHDSAIRTMLDFSVSDDFKTGKVTMVNGWVLSITEARQCALFSILQS